MGGQLPGCVFGQEAVADFVGEFFDGGLGAFDVMCGQVVSALHVSIFSVYVWGGAFDFGW